jgi:hypothetical protein
MCPPEVLASPDERRWLLRTFGTGSYGPRLLRGLERREPRRSGTLRGACVLGRGAISQVQDAGDSETERTERVADPVGFTYAFGKLEKAIEELVGAGDVKERLEVATMTLAPIFPDDFPAGHLRDEYADIHQALTWLPPEGSGQGLLESTLEAMMEEEAGDLAKSLFWLYTSAAEAVYGGLHGR